MINQQECILREINRAVKFGGFNAIAIHGADLFETSVLKALTNRLIELKQSEAISEWGLSLARPYPIKSIDCYPDFIQCNFNVLDSRMIRSGLYTFAANNNIRILARTIFFNGLFFPSVHGKTSLVERTSKEIRALIEDFRHKLFELFDVSLVECAYHYVCSFPFVTPLLGIRSRHEIKLIEDLSFKSPAGTLQSPMFLSLLVDYEERLNFLMARHG